MEKKGIVGENALLPNKLYLFGLCGLNKKGQEFFLPP